MVDTLKEFSNDTYDYSQLIAGVDIATTGVDRHALIKELKLRQSVARSLKLTVGGTTVVEGLRGDTTLGGTEYIGPESALKMTSEVQAVFNRIKHMSALNSLRTINTGTLFSDGTLPMTNDTSAVTTQTPVGTNLTVDPDFIHFDAAGNFYYGLSNSATLYKRAGGVNGAQTTISFGHSKVWDGDRYILGYQGTHIYVYDTVTGGASATMIPFVTAQSWTGTGGIWSMCAIDGFLLMHRPGANTLEIRQYIGGSAYASIAVPMVSNTSKTPMEIQKDLKGNYWVMFCGPTPTYAYSWNLGPDLSTATSTLAVVTSTQNNWGNGPSSTKWTNYLFKVIGVPQLLFFMDSTAVKGWDITTLAQGPSKQLSSMSWSNMGYFIETDLVKASNEFGLTTARVTGIEVS